MAGATFSIASLPLVLEYTFHVKAASNAVQKDWMMALDEYEASLYPNNVQKKKVHRIGTEWTKIWDELEAEKKAETETEEEPAPEEEEEEEGGGFSRSTTGTCYRAGSSCHRGPP